MFNDRYGLTKAVLSGHKTQTRRVVPKSVFSTEHDIEDNNTLVFEDVYGDWHDIRESRYALRIGEIVAVAQSYKDAGFRRGYYRDEDTLIPLFVGDDTENDIAVSPAGWTNKMFVRADLMPHQIHITDVRVERLQDISDEDCIKEGVVKREFIIPTPASQIISQYFPCQYMIDCATKVVGWGRVYDTPREAYAALIDKVSGKGIWESNPFVFVYDFELVK